MVASSWREPAATTALRPEYCKSCRKRLGDFDGKGSGTIVCPRCRVMNTLRPK